MIAGIQWATDGGAGEMASAAALLTLGALPPMAGGGATAWAVIAWVVVPGCLLLGVLGLRHREVCRRIRLKARMAERDLARLQRRHAALSEAHARQTFVINRLSTMHLAEQVKAASRRTADDEQGTVLPS